ncbi:DUF4942 domain-containing protein [Undibacterium oligocarboniphilum]|uniref:DUF4942 domain-containing protein n=1 Tax=Undibacterium oligocarboniphilum TaxID=666702 RepID=A0A850QJZ4_9BURK|nr:DUF4942 domain-containing protein [Undibacterium oligocarboniphilum]MBC3871743.1 DUF4942 domain-containing protein [Undibacterium oligocarboniphilum]NVO79379.1 DUF4942 domain-containing protein [Undibacterium oligocarboniphilum]
MSFQYYATGEHTAVKMWAKFKKPIEHVCEPNAGKGHLLRYALDGFSGVSDDEVPWLSEKNMPDIESLSLKTQFKKHYRQILDRNIPISVIEIDVSHHPNLKEIGSNLKIVGYDFLQTESLATVTHVIMNPPFSEGVTHVLHAWDIVYEAEIVAIINAETIRNPYSADRKRLVELIQKYGTVEFLKDEFIHDVERKTKVEVALIYLEKIPDNGFDVAAILSELSPRKKVEDLEPEINHALALPGNLVENTFERYHIAVNAAVKSIQANMVSECAENSLGVTLEVMQSKGVNNNFRLNSDKRSFQKAMNVQLRKKMDELTRKAWSQIIRSSLLTDKLSNQARRKMESEAESIFQLEFSIGNVHGFLAGLYASLGDIYADMICGMFDSIIGRDSDNVAFFKTWKSNEKHRFGMRIRRSRFIFPLRMSFSGLNYEAEQFLADIDKVFGYLHGISGKYNGLVAGFQNNLHANGERAKTEYFDYRYYPGVGSIHIFPKSHQVIEKLNLFVGKRRQWLPDQMEAANDDFLKQYEEAEDLSKKYLTVFRRTTTSTYRPAQLFSALRHNTCESDQEICQQMADCIDTVHTELNLQCGPSLTYSDKEKETTEPPLRLAESNQLIFEAL